jgi:hypothetical protein
MIPYPVTPFGATASNPGLYVEGDQYGGPNVAGFPMDAAGRAKLQYEMIQAGLLNPKTGTTVFVPGEWDTSSANAFAELLATSNQQGTPWSATLSNRISVAQKNNSLAKDATVRQRTPLVTRLTDPVQIAQAVNAAGKTNHGTYLSPDQLAAFTATYQAQEAKYQSDAYAATGFDPATGQQDPGQIDPATGQPIPAAGQGGIVAKAPDLASAADLATRTTDPNKFKANTFTDRLNEVLSGLNNTPSSATQVGPL